MLLLDRIAHSYDTALQLIKHIRATSTPGLLEISTYRWREHCGPNVDDDLGYRSDEEVRIRKERDPLSQLQKELLTAGYLTHEMISSEVAAIEREIAEAFKAVAA